MQDLTQREYEIMRLLEQGYKIKYIARNIFLAEETVLNHLQHIYDKFEIEPKDETYNRKTRSIYLFRQYKDKKTIELLKNIKNDAINKMDVLIDEYTGG